MIGKNHILSEIKRTAEENGGKALGKGRFYKATGIKMSDWYGKYWARWGDALIEAGYAPNQLQSAYSDKDLLERFASLIRELGRFPVSAELRMKARQDREFPSDSTFKRFGGKHELAARIVMFCEGREDSADVIDICLPLCERDTEITDSPAKSSEDFGSVYLIKFGKHFKIGRSNSIGRREYELSLQLPERCQVIHKIKTDDPSGIEQYWHKRFESSRKNGEWFELTPKQVSDFKRREFM